MAGNEFSKQNIDCAAQHFFRDGVRMHMNTTFCMSEKTLLYCTHILQMTNLIMEPAGLFRALSAGMKKAEWIQDTIL